MLNVAVLGASNKPGRYSYKAVMLLKEKGFAVYPVHRLLEDIEGITVYKSVSEIPVPLDVVTLYLGAANQQGVMADILASRPRRVIFNPGAENSHFAQTLRDAGIEALEACTLVMLHTGQFSV